MSSYSVTKARIYQWIGIILLLAVFAGAYWYFEVRAGLKINTGNTQPQGTGSLAAGLAGYWKLDDGSGTTATDASTNSNSGTLTNFGGSFWTIGQVSGALDFDGTNDYIPIADTDTLDFGDGDDFTLSAWFYRDTDTTYDTLISKRGSLSAGDAGYTLILSNSLDLVVFEVSDGVDEYVLYSGVTFTTPGWHHVVVTWDQDTESNVQMYVDGAQSVGSRGGTLANIGSLTNALSLYIGSLETLSHHFDGKLDEVRIYDRTLSVQEVRELYQLTAPTGVDTSLKGYWSFNGGDVSGTTAFDRSSVGNTGTLTNGPTKTVGPVGQALSFDGTNDYVTVADSSALRITGAQTISFWIKSTDTTAGLVSKSDVGAKYFGTSGAKVYEIGIQSGTIYYQIGDGTTSTALSGSATPIVDGTWHHIVCTWDGTTGANGMKLYRDSVLLYQTTSAVSTIQTATEALDIGGWTGVSAVPLLGSLDEVRIYSRALSAVEVKGLFDTGDADEVNSSRSQSQGMGRLDSDLAGYWKLDDGSGTSATDASTNGNTGTLTNGPTWTTGQIGSAVQFDGTDDYVDLGDVPITEGASQLTWSLWVNPTSLANLKALAAKFNSDDTQTAWVIETGTSSARILAAISTSTTDGSTYAETTTDVLTAGTWTSVIVVFDGTQSGNSNRFKIYINGISTALTYSGTIPASTLSTTSNVRLGSKSNNTAYFNGKLDEFRMYRHALSADEVTELYRLTVPTGVDANLKGYWSFNGKDVSGTTASDRSGAGNNGTLTNSPTKTLGPVGQALSFDGTNDYVHLGNNGLGTDLNGSTLVTLSAWIRPTAYPAGSARKRVISIDIGSSQTGLLLGLYNNSGNLLEVGARSQGADGFQSVTVTGPSVNEWHFVSGVIDIPNDTISVYMDGALMKTQTVTFGASSYTNGASPAPDAIGSFDGSAEYFTGSIDEARVYNRALSVAEIKGLYDMGQSDKVNSGASQPQGTGRLDSGLAGYWKLDDGSGTSATDASTNGNTGTLTNGPTWTTGQIGGAVNFDGTDDYITVADTSTLDFGDGESFTLSAWFYRDTSGTYDSIVTKRADATTASVGYDLIINDSINLAQFDVSDGTDTYYFLSNTVFTTPGWYHIAVTWDDSSESNSKLYVNAVNDTVSRTGTFASIGSLANAIPLGIGTFNGAHMFDGKIDDVRVYNRALSADEVSQLYRLSAPTGTDTSLKGYWSFNGKDISGTTAYDRSGAGNTGTLTNGPVKALGKIGQGLTFTASTNVVSTTTSTATGFGTGDFSYGAWVKTTGYSNQGSSVNTIIARGYLAQAASYGIGFTSANTPVCYVGSDGITTGGTALNDGQWHFVMLVRRSNVVECWQNGAKLTDGATTSNITSTDSLNFGNDSAGPNNRGLVGKLDEVRLYNRALSASEITALYNSSR